MSTTLKNRLHRLLFLSDLEGTRFTLALGAILIGLGFAWPSPIFPTEAQIAAGAGRHTYALMAQMAPEWLWSASFLFQGGVMMASLIGGCRNRWLLWLDAVLGVILWTTAILACYLAYWRGFDRIMEYRPPAIMGGEVAAMFASWWVLVRYSFTDAKENCRFSGKRGAKCG